MNTSGKYLCEEVPLGTPCQSMFDCSYATEVFIFHIHQWQPTSFADSKSLFLPLSLLFLSLLIQNCYCSEASNSAPLQCGDTGLLSCRQQMQDFFQCSQVNDCDTYGKLSYSQGPFPPCLLSSSPPLLLSSLSHPIFLRHQ